MEIHMFCTEIPFLTLTLYVLHICAFMAWANIVDLDHPAPLCSALFTFRFIRLFLNKM